MKPLLDRARIVQNAYIVNDLEKACRRFYEMYGVGPFLKRPPATRSGHFYRGEPADPLEISVAFVQSGDLNIEFIQEHSTGPSAFNDLYSKGREGFHHVAVFCKDYEAERDAFATAGYPVASEFLANADCQVCYVDTSPVLGHMIELYPDHPMIRDLYARTREAAAEWDGAMEIRTL